MSKTTVASTGIDLSDTFAFTGTVSGIPQGMVRLGGANATGQDVGDISFDLFTTDYDFYYVTYAISYASSSQFRMQLRASGSYITASNYFMVTQGRRTDGSGMDYSPNSGGGGTYFAIGDPSEPSNSHLSHSGHFLFHKPMVSSKTTQFDCSCVFQDTSANFITRQGGGVYLATGSHSGFGFLGSANLDEYNIQVFGVSQS